MKIPLAVLELRHVCYSESSRFALGCVLIRRRCRECKAVATDGRHLAVVEWEDDGPVGAWEVLVPRDALETAAAMVKELAGRSRGVSLVESSAAPALQVGEVTFAFKPVAGRFPDWPEIFKQAPSSVMNHLTPHECENLES